jgi:hypothetical protein
MSLILSKGGVSTSNILFDCNFYLITIVLILSIIPWIKIKRIQVESKVIGKNLFSLTIDRKPDYGTASQISLFDGEFHSFADSIYDFDENNKVVLYIAAVGDSTCRASKLTTNLEELYKLNDALKLWLRH